MHQAQITHRLRGRASAPMVFVVRGRSRTRRCERSRLSPPARRDLVCRPSRPHRPWLLGRSPTDAAVPSGAWRAQPNRVGWPGPAANSRGDGPPCAAPGPGAASAASPGERDASIPGGRRLSRSRGPARWMTSRSPPRRRTSPLVCTGDTAATVVPDDSVVEIGQGGGDAPIGVERLDIGSAVPGCRSGVIGSGSLRAASAPSGSRPSFSGRAPDSCAYVRSRR